MRERYQSTLHRAIAIAGVVASEARGGREMDNGPRSLRGPRLAGDSAEFV